MASKHKLLSLCYFYETQLHHHLPSISHIHRLHLSQQVQSKNKIRQKYNPNILNKSRAKSNIKNVNKLNESQSLSEYLDTSQSTTTGWNGVFSKCYQLLQYNPRGLAAMMHSFNVMSAGFVSLHF